MAENETAFRVCQAIGSGLIVRYSEQTKDAVRSYRGVNWQTIDAALTRFEISREQWQPMITKILAYASVMIENELREVSR